MARHLAAGPVDGPPGQPGQDRRPLEPPGRHAVRHRRGPLPPGPGLLARLRRRRRGQPRRPARRDGVRRGARRARRRQRTAVHRRYAHPRPARRARRRRRPPARRRPPPEPPRAARPAAPAHGPDRARPVRHRQPDRRRRRDVARPHGTGVPRPRARAARRLPQVALGRRRRPAGGGCDAPPGGARPGPGPPARRPRAPDPRARARRRAHDAVGGRRPRPHGRGPRPAGPS